MDRLTLEDYRILEVQDTQRRVQEIEGSKADIEKLTKRMDTLESKMKEHGHVLTAFQILLVKENDRLREENKALRKTKETLHE